MKLRLAVLAAAAWAAAAQTQTYYAGSNATGRLVLVRSVNALQAAQPQALRALAPARPAGKERLPSASFRRWGAPPLQRYTLQAEPGVRLAPDTATLAVTAAPGGFGFNGMTHAEQRLAGGGNQYSVEPPNPSIAAANGYVLQGVNNAVQVYNTSGTPQLPTTLTSNQLFGVSPAIIWSSGINGVYPTDMRVFYDHGVNRWFVLQRAQDYDIAGNPLPSSRLYLAVSQTANPLGVYNIYTMDMTYPGSNWLCPCIADYPQIGADQYGFYISTNNYGASGSIYENPPFADVSILAISKDDLAAGVPQPSSFLFIVPPSGTGYEFTIHPATTPPGASYFLGQGGAEYFVSSQTGYATDSRLALWIMTNTSSLRTPSPSPLLIRTLIPTMNYMAPNVANQKAGILPYGSSLFPPGNLPVLDGNDARIQSLVYAGGRLYTTLAADVTDLTGRHRVGGMYAILSPAFRSGVLTALLLRQGHVMVNGNHVLRPAVAVNAQGRGAIVFTLVGTDYYPSAAYLPIETFSTATTAQVPGPGAFPEDGFTGYEYPFIARWGDYSSAVTGTDGTIWMTAEYIPNLPRTQLANWGTYIIRYVP